MYIQYVFSLQIWMHICADRPMADWQTDYSKGFGSRSHFLAGQGN